MKKLTLIAAVAIAAATMTSCGNSTPKAKLKSDIDTLSYAFGMAQSGGVKDFLLRQGVDTAYVDEFIKGLNDGANAGENKKKAAYFAGIQVGQMISTQWVKGINYQIFGEDSTQTVSLSNILAGFVSGTTGKGGKMTMDQANMLFEAKMRQIKTEAMEKQYGPNKAEGEKFLAANAKKDGVKTLESGVQKKEITEGKGAIPADTSRVELNYEGRTIDGKVFDSTYERKKTMTMRANQFVKGFTDALVHMPEGSVWEVYIPQELAYGERELPTIKPFSTLIFKIELVSSNAK